ncbi:hypothetical protein [Pseudodesulfovibrio sp.]|uniref:hypothetical protein n=1 Tax=unclassified Pseudodesulfovibrio TaxID=2661612 RepID=UPI003AFFF1C2
MRFFGPLSDDFMVASQSIHAGPKGLLSRLGLYGAETGILLILQSNSGTTDPTHSTALSLVQATTNLLGLEPTIDHLVVMMIIGDMAHEIGEAFIETEKDVINLSVDTLA